MEDYSVVNHPTHYYGIWLTEERGEWWISDDRGGEEYCGASRPALEDIDRYRDDAAYSYGF